MVAVSPRRERGKVENWILEKEGEGSFEVRITMKRFQKFSGDIENAGTLHTLQNAVFTMEKAKI